jgi:hypothetical protein
MGWLASLLLFPSALYLWPARVKNEERKHERGYGYGFLFYSVYIAHFVRCMEKVLAPANQHDSHFMLPLINCVRM